MPLGRTLRTIRHLRPVQITNRLRRKLVRPRPRLGEAPGLRSIREIEAPCMRPESLLGGDRVELLGVVEEIAAEGDWNRADRPKLWLYNLHYHDGLRAEATSPERKRAFVRRWMAENPPLLGNGWEPYTLSLRIVNWILWGLREGSLDPAMVRSLAVQARALEDQLEYHLLGNHLWANAKALIFAGLFFEGAEAERWYRRGIGIAEEQRREQFLADGGHFELSPVYHQLMLEDVLDLINLSAAAGRPLPPPWHATATAALRWLETMTRPDGRVPMLNDSFEGVSPSSAELLSYAGRLGIEPRASEGAGLIWLPESGYARWTGGGLCVWADFGRIGPDYLPGHAHADCFSFELFADGAPIIVDTGVSTYEPGRIRDYERGSTAHNTMTICDADQAELWASFRVGRRPDIIGLEVTSGGIAAEQDGYDRLGARHRRGFAFEEKRITITDEVRRARGCAGRVTARLHFAPGVAPIMEGDSVIAGPLRISQEGATAARLEPCEIACGFERRAPSFCLATDFDQRLVTRIERCASSS